MRLGSFPLSSPVQFQADWVELKSLCDDFNFIPVADIRSAIELQEDIQDENIAQEDGEIEAIIDAILREIELRKSSLGSSYPYQVEPGGAVVSLLVPFADLEVDQKVYLYCLIFSHVTNSPVLSDVEKPLNSDRDIMQICATIAAAGVVRGHSISFGFPRRDKSRFYEKAREVLELLGEGELHAEDEVNPVHTLSPKDSGIDVISWEHTPDRFPGKKIYISQVASGHNWKDKPVSHYITILQTYWLKRNILSRINDAMFIPFDMTDDVDNRYTAKDLLESQLSNLGTIFYRRRVPKLFKEGLIFSQENLDLTIERVDECDKIGTYVESKVALIRQSAA